MNHYSGFTSVNGYLVERRSIRHMYNAMKAIFPFIHSVLSLTVSNPRGEQIPIFSQDDFTNVTDTPNMEEELSKRERAVLEFFIAQIRLRSQKTMGYWAMVPPLAAHGRGYMKNLPSHPLHGVGCDMTTMMWHRLSFEPDV